MDLSLGYLSKIINIPNFSPRFIADFDRIWRIPQKYVDSPWIRPEFITILFNSWLFIKICDFGIFFTHLRVYLMTSQIHLVNSA